MFKKVLIANRGEIAVRMIRAIRAVGAVPVAVYSDADRDALHVRLADEAYNIGPPPASESYLNIRAVLSAARKSGVDAIHPGYGFLSENPDFAEDVQDAGLTFIGPPSRVIRLMGDKIAAKRVMSESGVPVIPGYLGADQSDDRLVAEAESVGYPLMIKAAAGGGGRGMRRVFEPDRLLEAVAAARREAEGAFGDGRLFLERLLLAPRHIEVQVLADAHGHVVHLGERDCSIQRRHQKIVEESPSTVLDERTRAELGAAAVRGASSVGYVNAGTLEFLWSDGQIYFLEMNTRIQVEHPVTEMVTGIDLVKTQIEIAAGHPLGFDQDAVTLSGHAVECRLYAEDPDHEFLPQAGRITRFDVPAPNSDLRLDSGVSSGDDVPRFYDPMLAKIIARGTDRITSIRNLQAALSQVRVTGIKTNLELLKAIAGAPAFLEDRITTAFLDDDGWQDLSESSADSAGRSLLTSAVAAAAVDLLGMKAASRGDEDFGILRFARGWRIGGESLPLEYDIDGRTYHVRASRRPGDHWEVSVNGVKYEHVRFIGKGLDSAMAESPDLAIMINHEVSRWQVLVGESADVAFKLRPWSPVTGTREKEMRPVAPTRLETVPGSGDRETSTVKPVFNVVRLPAFVPAEGRGDAPGPADGHASGSVVAPMPGSVVKINVAAGEHVQAHQSLVVMEAMKMEHVLESPHAGTVQAIHFGEGEMVSAGTAVVEVDPD